MGDKITLGEGILSGLFIIASAIRYVQNKNATKAIETSQQNAANSTVIRVANEEAITRAEVKNMIDEHAMKMVSERSSHTEFVNEVRSHMANSNRYIQRLCAAGGIEWKDEVTLVPDHTKK